MAVMSRNARRRELRRLRALARRHERLIAEERNLSRWWSDRCRGKDAQIDAQAAKIRQLTAQLHDMSTGSFIEECTPEYRLVLPARFAR